MTDVPIQDVPARLSEIVGRAIELHQPTRVTIGEDRAVVVVDAAQWASVTETLRILDKPALLADMEASDQDDEWSTVAALETELFGRPEAEAPPISDPWQEYGVPPPMPRGRAYALAPPSLPSVAEIAPSVTTPPEVSAGAPVAEESAEEFASLFTSSFRRVEQPRQDNSVSQIARRLAAMGEAMSADPVQSWMLKRFGVDGYAMIRMWLSGQTQTHRPSTWLRIAMKQAAESHVPDERLEREVEILSAMRSDAAKLELDRSIREMVLKNEESLLDTASGRHVSLEAALVTYLRALTRRLAYSNRPNIPAQQVAAQTLPDHSVQVPVYGDPGAEPIAGAVSIGAGPVLRPASDE